MKARVKWAAVAWVTLAAWAVSVQAGDLRSSLSKGNPEIQAAGPIAFGPQGILFVGDPQSAAVFAIDTGDMGAKKQAAQAVNVQGLDKQVAAALGTEAQNVQINDLAANPASGKVYLSVSRGRGPNAQPVILRVGADGQLTEVSLKNVAFAKAMLPNAPPDKVVGSGRRQQNQRRESITDLSFVDGRVIVAGLSNEEFASKLRAIPFPFEETDEGTSVEIFHGSHGKFETRSPVRTFVAFEIGNDPHLLAAYTCTPLVKIPLKSLQPGEKVKGTTVAELGNRNRPLDMIVYSKGGQEFILMANNSRGVMKIPTEGLEKAEGIEERVPDVAGVKYETVKSLEGVEQLDQLDANHVVVICRTDDGLDLKTVPNP